MSSSKNEKSPSRWSFGVETLFSFTIFGYKFDFDFDLFSWHFGATELLPIRMDICFGPFYFGFTDITIRELEEPTTKDLLLEQLVKTSQEQYKKINELEYSLAFEKDEVEQLRVQLAGCAVAAQGYGEKLDRGTYGYSLSYEDTRLLYVKYRQALSLIEKLRGKQAPPKRSHHKAKDKKAK